MKTITEASFKPCQDGEKVKKEQISSEEANQTRDFHLKREDSQATTPVCLIAPAQMTEEPTLEVLNDNKIEELPKISQWESVQDKLDNNFLNNRLNSKQGDIAPTNMTPVSKVKKEDRDVTYLSRNITLCNEENDVKPTSYDDGILMETLKSEIELGETQVGFHSEPSFNYKKSFETPQLKIIVEKLTIANKVHKKAIDNLPKPTIFLQQINSGTIQKVNRQGFIKITSAFLKPLLPQRQKKAYPKGHYFSRLKNVVYEKDEFDKRFFHNALRRGANIDDQGKFLRYQCPKCPYKTWSFYSLSKHHKSMHGIRINWTFSCPDCNFTTSQECTLKRHQQRHKKKPDLTCPHCPYITRFDVALRVHLRKWHLPDEEAKTLKCTYCNFVSICKTTYDVHMMAHMRGDNHLSRFLHKSTDNKDTEVLKCEYCKFQTPDKNGLRRHMEETHKIKDPFKRQHYRCKDCGFQTKHKFSFKDHLLIHKNVKEESLLQCFDCGFKTKWRKYLVVHMRTKHPRPNQQRKTVYYHCAHCSKKFCTKTLLKDHIFKQHKDSEVLMCHQCNYTTKIMAVLKRHTLTRHVNPLKKIHRCQKCSHNTEDKRKHKAHLRTHKYECYTCGFKTLYKDTLRYHIVGHMSKKEIKKVMEMHKCQCCDYESRNKHHYERHMKRWNHFPENPIENKGNVVDKPLDNEVKYFDKSLKNEYHIYPVDKAVDDTGDKSRQYDYMLDNKIKEVINIFIDKASDVKN